MTTYLISATIGIVALLLGEQIKPNETKIAYEKQGYNWNTVLLISIIAGALGGVLSAWLAYSNNMPAELNPHFFPFVTGITAYVTAQSLLTDTRTLLINRKLLRVAYISTYAVSAYNVITNELLNLNWTAFVLFTLLLLIIFIFVPIGPSDVRMMAVAMPYTVSIGGYSAILLLIITLFMVAIGMLIQRMVKMKKEIEKYREKHIELRERLSKRDFDKSARKVIKHEFNTSEEHAVAVGPYMILPFLIYLIIYPVLL